MTCEECRERPATIHLTRIVNGKKTERHLCEHCARDLGEFEFVIEPKFSIPNLLAGLVNSGAQFTPLSVPTGARCELCGLSHSELARTGRLGCSHCYGVFHQHVEPLIRRIHGATAHVGKRPRHHRSEVPSPRDLERLRAALAECVAREEFERAAQIRDQIRELEQDDGRVTQ